MTCKYEIYFKHAVSSKRLDVINDTLTTIFGKDADIDWRDNKTVWIITKEVIIHDRTELMKKGY